MSDYPKSQMAEGRSEIAQRASAVRTALNGVMGYTELEELGHQRPEKVMECAARLRDEIDGLMTAIERMTPNTPDAPLVQGEPHETERAHPSTWGLESWLRELDDDTLVDVAQRVESETHRRDIPCVECPKASRENPAADALDRLWREIILARNPGYGDWEYPGMAYRHLLAEFGELRTALHDAIGRPMGVVPDSAAKFYKPDGRGETPGWAASLASLSAESPAPQRRKAEQEDPRRAPNPEGL